jgi:hypothetical protein
MKSVSAHPAPEPKQAPTKEQVRAWLMRRSRSREPLPGFDQLRNELGWANPLPRRG